MRRGWQRVGAGIVLFLLLTMTLGASGATVSAAKRGRRGPPGPAGPAGPAFTGGHIEGNFNCSSLACLTKLYSPNGDSTAGVDLPFTPDHRLIGSTLPKAATASAIDATIVFGGNANFLTPSSAGIRLYSAAVGANVYTPTSLFCTVQLPVPTVLAGDQFSCNATGAVPLAAGTRIAVGFERATGELITINAPVSIAHSMALT